PSARLHIELRLGMRAAPRHFLQDLLLLLLDIGCERRNESISRPCSLLHGGGKMNRRNSHGFIPRNAAPDVTGRNTPGREAVIAEIESRFRLYRDVTRPSLHTPTPSTTKVRCVYC